MKLIQLVSLKLFANDVLDEPKSFLLSDAKAFEELRRRIGLFHLRRFPRSFVAIVSLLAWLSITGIIWPLSALPGLSGSFHSKGLMLLAFSLGLLGLLGYYAYQLRELSILGKLDWGENN